jgi:hypothetical protein
MIVDRISQAYPHTAMSCGDSPLRGEIACRIMAANKSVPQRRIGLTLARLNGFFHPSWAAMSRHPSRASASDGISSAHRRAGWMTAFGAAMTV